MKKILSIIIAIVLTFCLSLSVFATGTKSSTVNIQVKPTTMNVTVPSSMPFVFNEDGTNTYPNNITITNNSTISNIYLAKVEMNGSSTGWKLLKDTYDVTNLSVNEKATIFKMGLSGALHTVTPSTDKATTGVATWTQSEFTIKSKETKTLAFDIKRGSFTDSTAQSVAYNITMTYNFCTYA